ncbi:hypothetical protein N6L27_23120 [Leisingera sp. SS27]|uniref:hypothetical protein n=1 Tax=Leisingera sp. SS27 TaxID=2979462 RepID=UPI00232C04B5|nr:hypothetical protein [Leisingera sp. SS27]MDC0660907.1 hypothetical protein [Leisingera sp. SS27]
MTRQYVNERRSLEGRLGIERERNVQLGKVSSGLSYAGSALTGFGLYVSFAAALGVTVMTAPVSLSVGIVSFFVVGVNSLLIGEAKSRSDARLRSLSQDLIRRNRLMRKLQKISRIKDRRTQDKAWQDLYEAEPEVVKIVAIAAAGHEIDRITGSSHRGSSSGIGVGYGGHYPSSGVSNGSYAIGIGNDYVDPSVRPSGGGGGSYSDGHHMALA